MIREPVAGPGRSDVDVDDDRDRLLAVRERLQEAGATLDELWLTAATDGRDEALRLAEASQAVHRALIVLTPPT